MVDSDSVDSQPNFSLSKEQFLSNVAETINELLNCDGGLKTKHPNIEIETQKLVLGECYRSAQSASSVFSTDNGLNYFREAGLYCYWLRKLKPFRLKNTQDGNTEKAESIINEFIAYSFAICTICSAQSEAFDKISSKEILIDEHDLDSFLKQNEISMQHNYQKNDVMEWRLINSFRYYSYSFGSVPMLLEAMFSLPLDEYAAR